jgi:DNA-binding IclR family transcriptional regulator
LSRRYGDRELAVRTSSSVGSWEALTGELDRIRECGYAVNLEEGEHGISAVAVAVRDLTGAPLAAIAVVVPAGRMTAPGADELAPTVLRSAANIEEGLRTEP